MCESSTRPAFIPVPNVAKLTMGYRMNDSDMMNVHYFEKSGGWNASSIEQLAVEAAAAWGAHLSALQPAALTLRTATALSLFEPDSNVFELPVSSEGTRPGEILPGNVTLAVKFLTGFSGRSRRGRMFWLQLVEDDVANDTVDAEFLEDLLNGIAQFFQAIETAITGTNHVVVSYCQDGLWLTEGETTVVNGYTSEGIVDSQRRRLTGRGR